MKIDIFIITYNDEKIISYTMRHYSQFATVTIIDNNSTDKTIEIASSLGANIRYGNMPDELDDLRLAKIKNNCWKGSNADWVGVVDADEFIYHPDLLEILKKTAATIIEPVWYEMFSETFPVTQGQIYEEVKTGVIGGGFKKNLFRPSQIKNMNWGVGCHFAFPEGNVKHNVDSGIMTLHMKNLSKQFLLDKVASCTNRLSAKNREMGWSINLTWTPEVISEYFDRFMKASTQILP